MPSRLTTRNKLLRGTFRKDREPKAPAVPRKGRAQPPAWLPVDARRAFRALVAELEATGIPSRSFMHALTGAAVAWADVQRCTGVLAREGSTYESVTTRGGKKLVARPETYQRNAALRILKQYLVELGLSPVGIGRVDRAALPLSDDDEEWNAFQNLDAPDFDRRQRAASYFGPKRA